MWNTSAPQGTVLAPFLFLFVSDSRLNFEKSCSLVKFADDTGLLSLISKKDDNGICGTDKWVCKLLKKQLLGINVKKTKNGYWLLEVKLCSKYSDYKWK